MTSVFFVDKKNILQENVPLKRKNKIMIKAEIKTKDKYRKRIGKEQTKQLYKKITNLTIMPTRSLQEKHS